MKPIALIGAAGAIGQSLASTLRSQGRPYRVIGRRREALQREFGSDPLAEIRVWNPDDPRSVASPLEGVDLAYYLVGVPYDRFELHPVLMQKTLDGAVAAGVRRMVLVGTVYPFGKPQASRVTESHPRAPHTFRGRMRLAQEERLLKAHADGLIEGAILRLPDFYGPGVDKSYLAGAFKAAANGGTAQMVGPLGTPHEFVYVPDVGPVAIALGEKAEAYGRSWNFAGAGVTTQREMADKAFAIGGRKAKLMVAPKWLLRVMGLWNGEMAGLAEMHYLHLTPVLLDDADLTRLLGPQKKTSYEEGIRRCVEAAKSLPATR